MIDLKDCTFIIPIRLESDDRKFNFEYCISYLCKRFSTNIIIAESGPEGLAAEILRRIDKGETKIFHWFEPSKDEIFHRTRLLNEAIQLSETPILVNYDCDVLLEVATYLKAVEEIRNNRQDIVYPYFLGLSQLKIIRPGMNSNLLEEQKFVPAQSVCGHCFFARKESYIAAGLENENMIGWAPEDSERLHRFKSMGLRVAHLDSCYVFHIEHSRGINSGKDNPMFEQNQKLYEKLTALTAEQLREYYKNAEYLKKYKS